MDLGRIEIRECPGFVDVDSMVPRLTGTCKLNGDLLTIGSFAFLSKADVENFIMNWGVGHPLELRLDKVSFSDEGANAFLSVCSDLRSLEIRDCFGGDSLLRALTAKGAATVACLSIVSENVLYALDVSALFAFFLCNPRLVKFELSGYYLDENYASLAEVFFNSALKEVCLDTCIICSETAYALACTFANMTSLEKLSLKKMKGLAEEGSMWDSWKQIFGSTTLKMLNLEGCSSPGLMRSFEGYPLALEEVNFSGCNLTDVNAILGFLLENPGIKKINLSNNNFFSVDGPILIRNLIFLERPLTVVFKGTESCFYGNSSKFADLHKRLLTSCLKLEFQPGCDPFENRRNKEIVNARKKELFEDNFNDHWAFSGLVSEDPFGLAIEEPSVIPGPVFTESNAVRAHIGRQYSKETDDTNILMDDLRYLDLVKNEVGEVISPKDQNNPLPSIRSSFSVTPRVDHRVESLYSGVNSFSPYGQSEEARKKDFLEAVKKAGFRLYSVKSDGTCLFHAAALWEKINTQESFEMTENDGQLGFDLRTQTIEYIRKNSTDYEFFFAPPSKLDMLLNSGLLSPQYTQEELATLLSMDDLMEGLRLSYGDNLERHLELMADPLQHADELAIVALSKLLKTKIVIFDRRYVEQMVGGEMRGMPVYGEEYMQEMHLLREGSHFDLLMLKNDQISFT